MFVVNIMTDGVTDLIQLEIEQIRNQIELLDSMFDEYVNQKEVSYCHSLKNLFNYYLDYGKESVLHKFRYSSRKEE